jgi:hypothetical protein
MLVLFETRLYSIDTRDKTEVNDISSFYEKYRKNAVHGQSQSANPDLTIYYFRSLVTVLPQIITRWPLLLCWLLIMLWQQLSWPLAGLSVVSEFHEP